jgi:hypothetical protein
MLESACKCACKLTRALEEAVGYCEKVDGRGIVSGWADRRRGGGPVTAVDLGFTMHGANHTRTTSIAAVPAKACPQTRWDSDFISPPVPSCKRPQLRIVSSLSSSSAALETSSLTRPVQLVPRHLHATQSFPGAPLHYHYHPSGD